MTTFPGADAAPLAEATLVGAGWALLCEVFTEAFTWKEKGNHGRGEGEMQQSSHPRTPMWRLHGIAVNPGRPFDPAGPVSSSVKQG